MTATLTTEQERDAQALSNYMTLSSLESELQDVDDFLESGDTYTGVHEVRAVIARAIEITEGY